MPEASKASSRFMSIALTGDPYDGWVFSSQIHAELMQERIRYRVLVNLWF